MEARDVMGVVGLIRNELGYDDISSDVYDRVMRIYNAENYVTFIAEEDESVIGFVGIMRGLAFELDGEYVRIIALAVSRGYQSLGVGSKLEARVEQYATETGANSIVISSGLNRNRAHVFYGNKCFLPVLAHYNTFTCCKAVCFYNNFLIFFPLGFKKLFCRIIVGKCMISGSRHIIFLHKIFCKTLTCFKQCTLFGRSEYF